MVARFIKVCPNKQYIRTLTLHFIFRSFSFDLPNRKHYSSNTRVQFFDVKHMILLILSDHHFLMIHDLGLRNHLYIHFHVIITLEIDVHSRFNFMFFVIYIFLKKGATFYINQADIQGRWNDLWLAQADMILKGLIGRF